MKRRISQGQRGSSMLEFAIASGVLFAVFAGTFQFGYTFYRYNVLSIAVNNGARYASVRPYDSSTSTPSSAFLTAVKNIVVYGDPAGGSTPVVPGLTTANVNLTVNFNNAIPGSMTVSVSGYTIDSVFTQTTMNGKPAVTYPYVGIFQPY